MIHGDLSIIARGSEIFMSRCLADFGITAAEVMILSYLYTNENPRQEDVARFFMLDKGTVAKTLKKLEAKEMIERQVNQEDQREKIIRLTDKGLCVQDVCVNLVRLWHQEMFRGIDHKDIEVFERVVCAISGNVASSLAHWEDINEKISG